MGRLIFPDETSLEGKTPLADTGGLLVDAQTQGELNVYEFANISKATTLYLARRPSEKKAPFTYEWFLKIHREMFGDVWEWAGKIRKTDKNIGIDKMQIPETLKNLEKDFHFWLTSGMSHEEIAARLHHRLVQIHPFENGNGRWARLITNIHLKQNNLPSIEWPDKALLKKTDLRKRYLEALREADQQNFKPLIELHKELTDLHSQSYRS